MFLTRSLGRTSRLKKEARFDFLRLRPNFESANTRSTLVRYFADSKSKTPSNSNHPQHLIHGGQLRTEGEGGHRIVDNNNQSPAVSLPGGLAFPFVGGSSAGDAAITTLIGLTMGIWLLLHFKDAVTDWPMTVFLGGVAYVAWYKKRVLDKVCLSLKLVSKSNQLL
jgi:hypothetical protein